MRIFGIKPWLTEIYDKAKDLTLALKRKEQNVNMISSFSDIVLTFLRNGIAYAYLINMALKGNLSAAEFVLYFAAFSGFTNWVRWILGNVNTLHRQSLDISTVREMIEYPEVFRLEDGGLTHHTGTLGGADAAQAGGQRRAQDGETQSAHRFKKS